MTLSVSIKHQLDGFELDVAFDAPAGLTALFGHSGSGKTSVINGVAGLMKPDAGKIVVDDDVLFDSGAGRWVPPHKRRIGYIFQEARLFPHLNVLKNLVFGQRFAGKTEPKADFERVVGMLGLEELLTRRVHHLSGGEKQRVAIGRALLARPRLILADEPLAALDDARKDEILPYFERLRDEMAVPILYVSHSLAEVARLATTVVVLDKGHVSHQGDTATLFSDPSFRPAGVRWVGALLEAKVRKHHADGLTELSAGQEALFLPRVSADEGSLLRVRISAQDVILSKDRPTGLSALNILPGVVENLQAGDGPGAIASVRTSAGLVLARITRRSVQALGISVGTPCHVVVKTVSIARDDIGGTLR
ncbi:molybdenum ABC transporter ATP-binding protein [Shimia thalassica]|uniref:molybdenum ABC transporter ATP-binding protein n=1 Tax=Shimia thalassica TaxID=1715693 RepID=UPI0026E24D5E|nr:molybdenum ABC transporter ATP-binding protein [Shimia thalassica]MDO6479452.1 molybdenum ABC transporter ATP-binding protein [Shimia thalassica]